MAGPRTLLASDRVLVFQSDDAVHGTGQSLHLVNVPCISMVIMEILRDPCMSRVVATKHRKKSPSQRRWPSYEGELKAMRDNVVDFGNLIIVADES